MKRTTTWVFGSPARPTLRPECYWLWLIAACQRVSLRASPEHIRSQCASNRTAGIARIGSAVATGALLTIFSLTSTQVQADKVTADSTHRSIDKPITQCRFQPDAGPEMVIIAAGKFLQGSKADAAGHRSDEAPQHPVTISKPFAIGRCEVTIAEFALFVRETAYQTEAEKSGGCYGWNSEIKKFEKTIQNNWKSPGFDQTENHPVTCISWNDTQAYLIWLNAYLKLPEKTYRLATESEWEYVYRAGSTSTYFWEGESQCDYANGFDQTAKKTGLFSEDWSNADCTDHFIYTAPVGRFTAHPWGVFDMAGNVWEWVEDCWHESYQDAPEKGEAWLASQCDMRSVRGGGWNNGPAALRSAYRYRIIAGEAGNILGFRLARTL